MVSIGMGVGQGFDPDSAFALFVHDVEALAQVATQPAVQVRRNDDVPISGVGQQRGEPAPVSSGAGLLVGVRPLG